MSSTGRTILEGVGATMRVGVRTSIERFMRPREEDEDGSRGAIILWVLKTGFQTSWRSSGRGLGYSARRSRGHIPITFGRFLSRFKVYSVCQACFESP